MKSTKKPTKHFHAVLGIFFKRVTNKRLKYERIISIIEMSGEAFVILFSVAIAPVVKMRSKVKFLYNEAQLIPMIYKS